MREGAEKLRTELQERGRFYFKGFGVLVQGVTTHLDIIETSGQSEKRSENLEACVSKMMELYESIPFEEIADSPDYDLLSEIKGAIFLLRDSISNILNGNTPFSEGYRVIELIHEKGMAFRKRLQTLLDELRTHEGCEKEGLQATDVINGRVWKSAI